MKKIILALILLTQPVLLLAAQSLNRQLVKSFYATSDKLDALEAKYPQEFKRMDDFSLEEKDKITGYIKSISAYPEIRSLLSANGFSSVDEFFDVSYRIMGSMYTVQMQKLTPQEKRQMDAMNQSFEESVKMMKQNGMPDSMIAGMKAQLQDMQNQQLVMQQLANSASKADIKFARENFDWLMKMMPEEEEHSDHANEPMY